MIIEHADPKEQLEFLEKAISDWKWAVFPLQRIKRNFDGSHVWCGCTRGLKCPTVGKHPLIHWTRREEYPTLGGVREYLSRGYTGWGVHLGFSGLVCIDLDPRNGADAKKFVREWDYASGSPLLATHTGSGGVHFYFPHEGKTDPVLGFTHPNGDHETMFSPSPGVDLFAGSHFCVLPFSPHVSGGLYTPFYPPNTIFFERIIDHVQLP